MIGGIESKVLKMVIFAGVFAWVQYYAISNGLFSLDVIPGGIFMGACAYLLLTLFGLCLRVTMNYIIAFIVMMIVLVGGTFTFFNWVGDISDFACILICAALVALALFFVYKDILLIKAYYGMKNDTSDTSDKSNS